MAIATGTAALIAAGIAAGGTVAATKISSDASKRAANISAHSTDQALAYQKEQDQYVRSRYELQDQREQEARRAYQQYLADHGKGPAPTNTNSVANAARTAVMQPGYDSHAALTLRDLAPGAAPAPPPPASTVNPGPVPVMASQSADVSTQPTLADVRPWTEWNRYLNQAQA